MALAHLQRGFQNDARRRFGAARPAVLARSRRMMFSTSMIASSTTTPTAITNPARIIVLMVAPAQVEHQRRRPPATSGMATRLINAVRHSKRKAPSTSTTSRQPSIRALVRLSSASLDEVAGRKMVESISIPGRPGRSAASASSTPCVTSRVLRPGILLDDQHQARPVVDDGIADERLGIFHHVGHITQAQRRAIALLFIADGHLGQVIRRRRSAGRAGC